MQPLKLIVTGTYWDSLIYSGRLYLFEMDRSVRTLNWDKLPELLRVPRSLMLALQCGFFRSDYLYAPDFNLIFSDADIQATLLAKFENLASRTLQVDYADLSSLLVLQQDNPFPFPHTSSQVYNNQIFVASHRGVYRSSIIKKNKFPIVKRPHKIADNRTLGISLSYGTVAMACGDDGLWRVTADSNNPHMIGAFHCNACDWNYNSIFASSAKTGGALASYKPNGKIDQISSKFDSNDIGEDFEDSLKLLRSPRYIRPLKEPNKPTFYSEDSIFQKSGYAWGVKDKICLARTDEINIVRYTPWDEDQKLFESLESFGIEPSFGPVVSATTAAFGIIVEFDKGLIVYQSDGAILKLPGEPVNWRAWPRAKHYGNQLHLIYEDRLEILSFNHDYFVDQKTKSRGIRHSTPYALPIKPS